MMIIIMMMMIMMIIIIIVIKYVLASNRSGKIPFGMPSRIPLCVCNIAVIARNLRDFRAW